jgi:hypothetical protein
MTETKLIIVINIRTLGNFHAFECGVRTLSCEGGLMKQAFLQYGQLVYNLLVKEGG